MANLTIRGRTGLDGVPGIRPVAAVRATLPAIAGEPADTAVDVWRLVLRSDGSILRSVRYHAGQYSPASWSGWSVYAAAPAKPLHTLAEYVELFPGKVTRYLVKHYGASVVVELDKVGSR